MMSWQNIDTFLGKRFVQHGKKTHFADWVAMENVKWFCHAGRLLSPHAIFTMYILQAVYLAESSSEKKIEGK